MFRYPETASLEEPTKNTSESQINDAVVSDSGVSYSDHMIDFNNSSFFRLSEIDPQQLTAEVAPLLVSGEEIQAAFKGIRDSVMFTNKRVIALNVQGMTGKKRDYTSLPYSKVQAFSVETAGTFDLDAELDLWFSGLGTVRFEFKGKVDIRALAQLIGSYVL